MTGANTITNISRLPTYAGICGVTETDLKLALYQVLKTEVMPNPTEEVEKHYAIMQPLFNGYQFAPETPRLFGTVTVANYLNALKKRESPITTDLVSEVAPGLLDLICTTGEGRHIIEQL